MTLGSERGAVQNPFIRYAEEAGWTYLPPDEAMRQRGPNGIESPLLYPVLVNQLQRLNPGVVDLRHAEDLARRIAQVRPNIKGNLEAWEWLKGLKTVFMEDEKRELNVRFMDMANLEVNAFHVTDEYRFKSGTKTIRADIVFFINGVPVIIIETKAAHRIEGIAEAFDQIRRYHREGPELMAVLQLHSLTHLVEFFYGATWSLSRKALFNWRDEQAGDFETLVKTFIAPRRVMRVINEFILFTYKESELSKVVLRPHQMRAVERVLGRAREKSNRRGLIWHTQGSGKTYTMITVAKLLLEDPVFENPTVLMLVDRNELQAQLFGNLESVGFGRVKVAESKRNLRKLLEQDYRGLIVSMIHKFDDMPANMITRENFFVLVDEAHRSTGAELGNYLMGALPNATYVGFTGTPIDKTSYGKGTFKTFGIEDVKGYLDKYSIRESIQDGTTVPLHYALAPNELLADRDAMEREFWRLAELEGVSDVEELNRVLDRAVTLKNMLKNPERVEKVGRFVADHFKTVIEPMGYKAFVVGVDREACALYKKELDKHLPPEYSEVVYSPFYNDPPLLAEFHLSEKKEQQIRKNFRKPDQLPKILIVTEKLLTGYDVPILYCMYLDKPMRDHVLLQAIARVNRPYEDEGRRKISGFILDFVGIFDKLEKALAFDSKDVEGVIEGIDVLKERFEVLMKEGREKYLPLTAGKADDKAAEAVLEYFRDQERREEFYKYFRELEEVYEILSPDPFLRPFLADYEALTYIYKTVRSAYEPHVPVDKSFLRKTAEVVQKHTRTYRIFEPEEVHEIGAETIERLAGSPEPETVKVFNLIKAFYLLVSEKGQREPYLIPIGERAEQIARMFKDRQITAKQALRELEELGQEVVEAEKQRKESELSAEGFAVFWFLKREGVKKATQIAEEASRAFEEFPHWCYSEDHAREVRKLLYKALVDAKVENMVDMAHRIMKMLRRES